MRRLVAALGGALVVLIAVAATASAHPLGNYTVNRGVAVTVEAGQVQLRYLVDMAEIPAFNEIAAVDANGDGTLATAERAAYVSRACGTAHDNLRLILNGSAATLVPAGEPQLWFPAGAGGLRTLRLVCTFTAPMPERGTGSLEVADLTDDGHVGWHEVTIAGARGVRITGSDVPAQSDSAYLTSYPPDRLQTPPDVRQGSATFELDSAAGDATAAISTPGVAPTANDPLAALVGGQLSPIVIVLALLLAAGLGAAHALSPGHGKTLVAAYLVGSRGTVRQAMALGLTVAATHTAGVLVLGVLVLVAGELFLPERLISWLTAVSGAVMAALGAALVIRAARGARAHGHTPDHGHEHPHPHPHRHEHPPATLSVRSIALLGMAGGMVPSASALIVLLAAVTTGRLAFGLALIGAFGLGMALVLGGIAVATTLAHGWLSHRFSGGLSGAPARAWGLVPIGSGMLVAGVGLVLTMSALTRLG